MRAITPYLRAPRPCVLDVGPIGISIETNCNFFVKKTACLGQNFGTVSLATYYSAPNTQAEVLHSGIRTSACNFISKFGGFLFANPHLSPIVPLLHFVQKGWELARW